MKPFRRSDWALLQTSNSKLHRKWKLHQKKPWPIICTCGGSIPSPIGPGTSFARSVGGQRGKKWFCGRRMWRIRSCQRNLWRNGARSWRFQLISLCASSTRYLMRCGRGRLNMGASNPAKSAILKRVTWSSVLMLAGGTSSAWIGRRRGGWARTRGKGSKRWGAWMMARKSAFIMSSMCPGSIASARRMR